MGKGDQRSRRGKISAGTYGKSRPKKRAKAAEAAAPEQEPKQARKKTKKAE
ncbi:MAG: 30S ribosomal protein THX [Chloracidobacterium sp.]|nr:30S ribosomal protein THX [Chloracidobacterium sp.]MCC6826502.1 30S ribosomal protein THX [Acidobacteriota bacterium]MCO5334402.1 30S ribosomal protein THX [Pyrinomonadaceae bacterium]